MDCKEKIMTRRKIINKDKVIDIAQDINQKKGIQG